jgi:hypothetical protein
VPYRTPDGALVANSFYELVANSGNILSPINITETNTVISASEYVWTATDYQGNASACDPSVCGEYCEDWSSTATELKAMVGDPYQTTRQWTEALTWGGAPAQQCDVPQHLYCFQQDDYFVSTNPNNPDTDGDGFSDLHEVQGNTDPNITEDYPIISQLYVDAA